MSAGKLPEGWVNIELNEIASDISYGYTASSSVKREGPHMLRITDIQNNTVNWSNVPFCQIEDKQKEKYLLADGDLVFARTGATVGKSFLIKGDIPESIYASYLIRVRCNGRVNKNFLSYFFRSPEYWSQITELSAGIGQPNVNGSKLKKLILPITSTNEQKIIAEKLDTLLAQVDSTQARLEQILQILKRFRQA
ncbi:restriction endonuclease subunit S, partial [Escherichia marmotae]|nr:restriction endonuclease subunit S [Escherichia marmotae]